MSENHNNQSNLSVELPKKRPGKKAGSTKTGGRKKGSQNKDKLGFEKKLEEQNFCVVEEMVTLYKETQDMNTKLRIIELICRHSVPVPKPVDAQGSSKDKIEINYSQES